MLASSCTFTVDITESQKKLHIHPPSALIQEYSSADKDHMYTTINIMSHTLTIAQPRIGDLSDDDEDYVDPMFFDPSYDLATATGFAIWEGARVLLSFLTHPDLPEALLFRQRVIGNKVLELGSGTGIAGLGVAMVGAHVLLTDVDCVVDLIKKNIVRNHNSSGQGSKGQGWDQSEPVGDGTAVAQTLDWKNALDSQATPNDPRDASVIIAAETAWLKTLARHFVQTLSSLLHMGASRDRTDPSPSRICYWAYKERGTETSEFFTTEREMLQLFADAQCRVIPVYRESSKEEPDKSITVNIIMAL